jgi:hypothetical protein
MDFDLILGWGIVLRRICACFGNSSVYPSQTCLDTVIEGDEFESSGNSTEGSGIGMNNEARPDRSFNIVQVEREPNGFVRRYSDLCFMYLFKLQMNCSESMFWP